MPPRNVIKSSPVLYGAIASAGINILTCQSYVTQLNLTPPNIAESHKLLARWRATGHAVLGCENLT
jgi:hypothetical protein